MSSTNESRLYEQATFSVLPNRPGYLVELSNGSDSFAVFLASGKDVPLATDAHHWGFVLNGGATLESAAGSFSLKAGMYFTVPGNAQLGGNALVFSQHSYRGVFLVGGPIENEGRLRYIDGCSDSLLIPPIVKGDACLNYLHIPPETDQTAHTHPSFRVGIVVGGLGQCRTDQGIFELKTGNTFVIHADRIHSFHTGEQSLSVIAFHPDSDFGPTHEDHPMINRTIVDSQLEGHDE